MSVKKSSGLTLASRRRLRSDTLALFPPLPLRLAASRFRGDPPLLRRDPGGAAPRRRLEGRHEEDGAAQAALVLAEPAGTRVPVGVNGEGRQRPAGPARAERRQLGACELRSALAKFKSRA